MTAYNILILSAGRRVELIQSFINAAQKLNIESNVVAGDCSGTAPALYFANKKVILPRIDESNYVDEIINLCKVEKIKLIVPTIDTDLEILSQEKDRIESESKSKVLISSLDVIAVCRDKVNTQKFLESHGFKVPRLYKEEELNHGNLKFPLFIKPKSGSSSKNAYKVNNLEELTSYREIVKDYIVQDFLDGEEFTIDVCLDFEGNLITAVPRLRMETRSGEISKGKIIKDREIIDEIKNLVKNLKAIGHITVQLMKTNQGIYYIEINPRFGGGAPMSIRSGADSCENIYRLLMNEQLHYNENYQDDLIFLRYDHSICLNENMEIIE